MSTKPTYTAENQPIIAELANELNRLGFPDSVRPSEAKSSADDLLEVDISSNPSALLNLETWLEKNAWIKNGNPSDSKWSKAQKSLTLEIICKTTDEE